VINDEYHSKNQCILITVISQGPDLILQGKGQPDVATRLMVKRLSQLNIPIYALMDADPYGIEILTVYAHGSRVITI
jgi:meiotic recombination protein SPO11